VIIPHFPFSTVKRNFFESLTIQTCLNGPKVQAKGTSCCCSRYRWYQWYRLQQQLVSLALDRPRGGQLAPGGGTNRFQCGSIGTGLYHHPVPNADAGIGTGWWDQPVPIVLQTAPGPATTRCRLTLGPKAPVCALTRCY